MLLNGASTPRHLFFYYRGTQLFAVRKDQWKLHLLTQKGYGQPKPDAHEPPLLFDLNADPGESFNLSTNHPSVVTDLLKEIEALAPARNAEAIQRIMAIKKLILPDSMGERFKVLIQRKGRIA